MIITSLFTSFCKHLTKEVINDFWQSILHTFLPFQEYMEKTMEESQKNPDECKMLGFDMLITLLNLWKIIINENKNHDYTNNTIKGILIHSLFFLNVRVYSSRSKRSNLQK